MGRGPGTDRSIVDPRPRVEVDDDVDRSRQTDRAIRATTDEPSDPDESGEISANVLLLVVTLAAGTVAQGGFDGPSRWVLAGGILLVLVTTVFRPSVVALTRPALMTVAALGALMVWTIVRGIGTDGVASGTRQAGMIAGLVIVVTACRRAASSEHGSLVVAIIAIGVFVALTGWLGVAFRVEPWGHPGPSTWRASSTLTYPNASAAVIVMALCVALMRQAGRRLSRVDAGLCAVLSAGLFATQSRGGAVAMGVALVALAILVGPTTVARRGAAPFVGGAIAFGATFEAFDATGPARPALMLIGLGVGVLVGVVLATIPRAAIVAGVAVGVAGLLLAGDRLGDVASDRLSVGAGERGDTTNAALELIRENPLVGVGPGNAHLVWQSGDRLVTTGLVHNEYLQVTAELGAVGAVILVAVLLTATKMLLASRASQPDRAAWAGLVAALAAFAVHSALDFLWHIPMVALLAAVLFGVATAAPHQPQLEPTYQQANRRPAPAGRSPERKSP